MTRLSRQLLIYVAFCAAISAPTSVLASTSTCPPPSEVEQNDQIIAGNTWLPIRIGIEVAKAGCRAHDFLTNFFKRQTDPDKATLDDVMEAAKPDFDSSDAGYQAKSRSMPSPTKSGGWNQNPTTSIVVLPPNTAGGVPVLFQPNAPGGPTPTSVAGIHGSGTLLSAEGMKRGTFQNGKLNGVGEEIDPDGTWRSGTYDRGTNTGQVFEVRIVNGKTYLVAGSAVNGKLDGMVERIYADGSTQFEGWEGGKMMQVGVRAPKGQTALAPQARYKPPVQVAMTDAYKHTGPRTKIAPGTTFDPARTTRPSSGAKSLSFQEAFAEYRNSCQAVVSGRYEANKHLFPDRINVTEQLFRSAGIGDDWAVKLFTSKDIIGYMNIMDGPQDYLPYSAAALSICAVRVRMRQLGVKP